MNGAGYYISFFFLLIGVFFIGIGCYQCVVDANGRIKEVAGHIYIWKIGDGYVHDVKCPACQ